MRLGCRQRELSPARRAAGWLPLLPPPERGRERGREGHSLSQAAANGSSSTFPPHPSAAALAAAGHCGKLPTSRLRSDQSAPPPFLPRLLPRPLEEASGRTWPEAPRRGVQYYARLARDGETHSEELLLPHSSPRAWWAVMILMIYTGMYMFHI